MKAGTAYAFYESKASLDKQNQNVVARKDATEFPRNIYVGESFNPARCQPLQYTCQDYPRDRNIDYFFGTERTMHPGHFSRFGYEWCPNGYCIGNHPGRYNTPPAFRWQTSVQPLGMAPERFYHGKYVDPNYTASDAYVESFESRNSR